MNSEKQLLSESGLETTDISFSHLFRFIFFVSCFKLKKDGSNTTLFPPFNKLWNMLYIPIFDPISNSIFSSPPNCSIHSNVSGSLVEKVSARKPQIEFGVYRDIPMVLPLIDL